MYFALGFAVAKASSMSVQADDQTPAVTVPAPPAPLASPAMIGPLANLPPAVIAAGPFGKLSFNGFISALGIVQNNPLPGDKSGQGTISNAFFIVQKTDGWFQFYLQAGAYNIPTLGLPYVSTGKTISDLYSPLPVAYAKFQTAKNTSILVGELPTLIGAEDTFSFENMNINRGLLWNQGNSINRGIQVNQSMGKATASISWNDGFYSNRYDWLTSSLGYSSGPHALTIVAAGNFGATKFQNLATLVQNNSRIYEVIYMYTKGNWVVEPYYQFTDVPTNVHVGILKGANTNGGAILLSHTFRHGFSMPVRFEYISTSGSNAEKAVNLLFGAGSTGTSFTVTPTFQTGGFFARGDASWTYAGNYAPGLGFGSTGLGSNQFRAAAEVGFVFGNNLIEKK